MLTEGGAGSVTYMCNDAGAAGGERSGIKVEIAEEGRVCGEGGKEGGGEFARRAL